MGEAKRIQSSFQEIDWTDSFTEIFLNLYIKQKTCLWNHVVVAEFLGTSYRLWFGLKRGKSQ